MQFSDLPNGGHNLRLYTYDPIGSQFGPPNAAACPGIWIYNTGHFDIALGIPCSQADPQGFCDWDSMSAYAGSRGESLVMVARSDLQTLCAYRAPAQVSVGAPTKPLPGGSIPASGGISQGTISISGGGSIGSGSGVITPGVIPSPGVPIDSGGLPGGVGNVPAPSATLPLLRFILYDPSSDPHNPYATGANYNGCSQVNTVNCKAMSFPTLQAAIDYAESVGEIPYKVLSANEPWGIINGTIPLDPSRFLGKSSQGLSLPMIAAVALGLWFLSGR